MDYWKICAWFVHERGIGRTSLVVVVGWLAWFTNLFIYLCWWCVQTKQACFWFSNNLQLVFNGNHRRLDYVTNSPASLSPSLKKIFFTLQYSYQYTVAVLELISLTLFKIQSFFKTRTLWLTGSYCIQLFYSLTLKSLKTKTEAQKAL